MKAFTATFAIGAILGTALATPINVGDTAVERRDAEADIEARQFPQLPPLPPLPNPTLPNPTLPYGPILPTLPPISIPTLPPIALPTLPSIALPTLPAITIPPIVLPTLGPLPGLPDLPPIPLPNTPAELVTALKTALTQIITILTAISKLLFSSNPRN